MNAPEVDTYLKKRRYQAERVREEVERRFHSAGLRTALSGRTRAGVSIAHHEFNIGVRDRPWANRSA